jgi:chorismate mutase/prephenate dehydrogenase
MEADERRLESLREEIARADDELVELLARRLALAREIGEIKSRLGIPVLDPAREAEVVRRAAAGARDHGVDAELVRAVLWRIMDHARELQQGRTGPTPHAEPRNRRETE